MEMSTIQSQNFYKRASQVIPGGVNSPVRAFGAVDAVPRFINKAEGAWIWDEDGNQYIDYIGSWGPMILGHSHPQILEAVKAACEKGLSFGAATKAEVEMAELICEIIPSIEMIRMVNSGTEAVMSAVRAARGYTEREKIIKFAGCYHGHSDGLLVKAGSGAMAAGVPDSAGVTVGCTSDTLTAIYNNKESVEKLFSEYPGQIAALIIEPVGANMGVVLPEDGFLEFLREICTANNTVLIFDEVITGFRLALDGAQGYYGIQPDLTVFGKIIGGGMPVGAYGGKKEIMQMISPAGPVYQAGTLSGNPVAMAAGIAQLNLLKENPHIYKQINEMGDYLFSEIETILCKSKKQYTCSHIGSLGCLFFTDKKVSNYTQAQTADLKMYSSYFRHMLDNGIYLAPAQFEAMFISAAHSEDDINKTLEAIDVYFH